ncbi:MAG: hypothetical protein ABGW77_02505 [Campylobacterales bacterium]
MEIGKWIGERFPALKTFINSLQQLNPVERSLTLLRGGVLVVVGITLLLIILSSIFPGWHGWGGEVEKSPLPIREQLHQVIFEKGGEGRD